MTPRTWLVIPVIAIGCAAIALAARQPPAESLAIGGLAAAIAAAAREYTASSIAAAVTAAAAALLATLGLLELDVSIVRAALGGAAAMFAIAELARLTPAKSPFPAIGAALLAAVLDPSFVALVAISGVRFVQGPWSRPRWAIAVPIAGAVAIILAIAAGTAHHGLLARGWRAWTGSRAAHAQIFAVIGDAIGPITAVAAITGLIACVWRGRYGAATITFVAIGALAVDLRTGSLGGATVVLAALAAGVGVHRLAAMVRWSAGQTLVGATASFILLFAPLLALVTRT